MFTSSKEQNGGHGRVGLVGAKKTTILTNAYKLRMFSYRCIGVCVLLTYTWKGMVRLSWSLKRGCFHLAQRSVFNHSRKVCEFWICLPVKLWRLSRNKHKSVLPNPIHTFVDYKGCQYVDLTLNYYNIMQIEWQGQLGVKAAIGDYEHGQETYLVKFGWYRVIRCITVSNTS